MQQGPQEGYPPPPPNQPSSPPPPPPDYYEAAPEEDWHEEPYRRIPSKKGRGKKLAVALIALLLVFLALFGPFIDGRSVYDLLVDELANPSETYYEYADISVVRSVEIDVYNGNINYTVDLPIPTGISTRDGSPVQTVSQIDGSPAFSTVSKYGTDWMVWEGSTGQGASITVTYGLRSYTIGWKMTSDESGTVDDINNSETGKGLKERYTGEEWLIQPSLVLELATELTSGADNVYDKVKAVYDWMVDEFQYESFSRGEPQSCTETLASRSGDCDDQSILFCSLLRSLGIPAWLEFGVLYDPSDGSWGAHGWANVYIPTDDGGGSATVDIVNEEFMVRNCLLFTEWISDGDEDHLQDYYYTMDYTYNTEGTRASLEDDSAGTFEPSVTTVRF